MDKKELFELEEWQVLDLKEYEEIELIPEVIIEFNGTSGQNEAWRWYTAVDTITKQEFNFYLEFKEEK